MKTLFTLIFILSISFGGQQISAKEVNSVAISEWYPVSSRISYSEFEQNCANSVDLILETIKGFELKYDDIQTGDLDVEMDIHTFWYRSNGRSRRAYSCDAKILNQNPLYFFNKANSKILKRLKKKEHKTACNKIINENQKTKEILFQDKILAWTLLQGRLCYVYSVELLKK